MKYINKILKNPLFSGSAIMIIGSNSASAINYLYHLIVGRLLGPASYGELASLISVISLLGVIPAAFSLVIVKQISSAKSEVEAENLIRWFKAKISNFSLIFSLIVLISSPFISSFLNINKVSYLILISLSLLFSLQAGFKRSILHGLLKFKEMIISILAENLTKLFISVLLISIGLAVNGVMLAFVFASLLGLYLTSHYLRIRNQSNYQAPDNIKPMLVLAIPVLVQAIATTSIYSSDVVLVKHFFSSHEAGIYAAISTLGKIIFFGAGPISSVMFPLISKRSSKGEGYMKVLIYSFVATLLFALGICLFYLIRPQLAINLLFGSAYLESSSLLIWFGVFMTFFTLSSLLINFGISLGKNKIVFFPLVFAILQIILIYLFHQSLFIVILISNGVAALLLLTLLIYLSFEKELVYGKSITTEDKLDLNNSTSI